MNHLASSWKLIQVYLSFRFQHMWSLVKIPTIVKIHCASIWLPVVLQIWQAKNPTIGIASHVFSTTLMDLHKIVQPIADFENMQVPITPIIKEKLLVLQIWLILIFIEIYDCINLKNLHVIGKTKKLICPMTNLILSQSCTKHHQWLILGAKIWWVFCKWMNFLISWTQKRSFN
jgi:hypothetical protein